MKIKRLRLDKGVTQQQLADAIGISRVAVSKWESGETKDLKRENLIGIAKFFGMTLAEVLDVDESMNANNSISNTEPGPDIRGKVPLISWVQAGAFCNAVDLFEPGVADDWIPAVQALGPHAYALRVVGDSMTAPHGLSYPEGIIIFVDPDYPVTNGCRVIAKLPHADEATFKVYSEDAGQKFLKPLNPQYPTIPITPDMRLCGVVRGAYRPE